MKTPTLVIAGERDAECPALQSYVLACFENARRADTTRRLSQRRPSLHQVDRME